MADVGVQLYNPEDLNERWFPVTTSDMVSVDGGGSLSDSLDNFKTKQTPVSDGDAVVSGDGIVLVDSVTQNQNGVISVHKKTIPKATAPSSGSAGNAGLLSAADKAKIDNIGDIDGKADKVTNATSGNFAALDSNGNLTDSGHKHSDYKTTQTAVADPSAEGTGITFIDSITQNTNGEITPHKKTVRNATMQQSGLMSSSDKILLSVLESHNNAQFVPFGDMTINDAICNFFEEHSEAGDLEAFQDILFYAGTQSVTPTEVDTSGTINQTYHDIVIDSAEGLIKILMGYDPHTRFNISVQFDVPSGSIPYQTDAFYIRFALTVGDTDCKIILINNYIANINWSSDHSILYYFANMLTRQYGDYGNLQWYACANFSIEYMGIDENDPNTPAVFLIS